MSGGYDMSDYCIDCKCKFNYDIAPNVTSGNVSRATGSFWLGCELARIQEETG
jgi:hypothetical protein